ncbi:hypothetical protein QJQ45_013089 [Haematococcus lacustris]|nr:hypothetical protein QJQ45_013089 [Haematococcus lacustris]
MSEKGWGWDEGGEGGGGYWAALVDILCIEPCLPRLLAMQALDKLDPEGAELCAAALLAGTTTPQEGAPCSSTSQEEVPCTTTHQKCDPCSSTDVADQCMTGSTGTYDGAAVAGGSGSDAKPAHCVLSDTHVSHLPLNASLAKACDSPATAIARTAACAVAVAVAAGAPVAGGRAGEASGAAAVRPQEPLSLHEAAGVLAARAGVSGWPRLLRSGTHWYAYKVAVLDLDVKSVAKIPAHARLDRQLVRCAIQHQSLLDQLLAQDVAAAPTQLGAPSSVAEWLYPVRSMATRSRIRGLMCSTSNVIKRRFFDRDVSATLNIRRIAAGPGRPRELSSWLGRPAMPNPGRPGQEWVHVRDKGRLRKWQRRHQRQRQ